MTLVQLLVETAQERPILTFAVISVLLLTVAKAASTRQEYPSLPWIGKDDSKSFASTRATFSSISNVKNWLAEGYQQVGYSCRKLWLDLGLTGSLDSTRSKANHTSFRTFLDVMRLSCPTIN
jgi:hypothetical protein